MVCTDTPLGTPAVPAGDTPPCLPETPHWTHSGTPSVFMVCRWAFTFKSVCFIFCCS